MPGPTIIVHGGAGTIRPYLWEQYKRQSQAAAQAGQAVLDQGGTALDGAVAAVLAMEEDETFNAGKGSCLTREGVVETDAFVMDDQYQSGAVACVVGVRNPVLLARAVMDRTPHQLVVGTGAVALARELGIPLCDPADLVIERRRARLTEMLAKGITFDDNPETEATDDPEPEPGVDLGERSDTVGAAALDAQGHFAVASSTGGIMGKLPGRVGDVPVIGSGSYCGPAGAVTCTGHGEAAMRVCLAKHAYDLLTRGADAREASRQAIDHLVATVQGLCGLVVIDRQGRRAWCTSTRRIAVGIPEQVLDAREGGLP